LIQLIQSADYIIGADSLPIHLSQFLHKPHFILYPDKGSKAFFTPYALIHNSYSEFSDYGASSIPFLSK
jgi:ADP-heptose:LPS heptosyltransferase